jgi:hypothetical protein
MGTNNEEGLEQVVLQNEQVLAQLKAMDGHVGNLKCIQKGQNVIDGTLCPPLILPTFNYSIQKSFTPSSSCGFSFTTSTSSNES